LQVIFKWGYYPGNLIGLLLYRKPVKKIRDCIGFIVLKESEKWLNKMVISGSVQLAINNWEMGGYFYELPYVSDIFVMSSLVIHRSARLDFLPSAVTKAYFHSFVALMISLPRFSLSVGDTVP
jgi:hypothetical protein